MTKDLSPKTKNFQPPINQARLLFNEIIDDASQCAVAADSLVRRRLARFLAVDAGWAETVAAIATQTIANNVSLWIVFMFALLLGKLGSEASEFVITTGNNLECGGNRSATPLWFILRFEPCPEI